tara:strand:+ start:439 stop:1863 length:1425 start_codon:yes stop_codon:yes gene_type:complete
MNIFLIDSKKLIKEIKKNKSEIIISCITVFFSCIIYLSLPFFYNYENFDKEIQKNIAKDFKLNIKNIKGIQYSFFPQPHFIIEQAGLYFLNNDKNELANIKNLKVYVFLKNLQDINKIEIKKIQINNSNFNFKFIDIKNFNKHLKKNITKKIEIKNSNFFYKNDNDEIISISNSKKFDYFIDVKKKQKKLNILGNIFGTDYKFHWLKDYDSPKITESNFSFRNPKINIINTFKENYETNKVNVFTKINFLNYKTNLNYRYNEDLISFFDGDDTQSVKNKIKLLGNVELKPFFFNLDLYLNNVEFRFLIKELFFNLDRLKNISHNNFNGNFNIYLKNLNSKLFNNFEMKIKCLNEKIIIDNSSVIIKNIGKINFTNIKTYEKDDELYFKTKIEIAIDDQQQFYQRFQILRENRFNLKKIYIDFEHNLDRDKYYFSGFYLNDKKIDEDFGLDLYEVSNYQQLTLLIRKEFSKIKKE